MTERSEGEPGEQHRQERPRRAGAAAPGPGGRELAPKDHPSVAITELELRIAIANRAVANIIVSAHAPGVARRDVARIARHSLVAVDVRRAGEDAVHRIALQATRRRGGGALRAARPARQILRAHGERPELAPMRQLQPSPGPDPPVICTWLQRPRGLHEAVCLDRSAAVGPGRAALLEPQRARVDAAARQAGVPDPDRVVEVRDLIRTKLIVRGSLHDRDRDEIDVARRAPSQLGSRSRRGEVRRLDEVDLDEPGHAWKQLLRARHRAPHPAAPGAEHLAAVCIDRAHLRRPGVELRRGAQHGQSRDQHSIHCHTSTPRERIARSSLRGRRSIAGAPASVKRYSPTDTPSKRSTRARSESPQRSHERR